MIDIILKLKDEIVDIQIKRQKIQDILFGIGACILLMTAIIYAIWQLANLDPLVAKAFYHIGG